ncbi:hypothetical protein CPAV1605_614 [seawater metagenome]|uniref:N-acetyltransferase domain-containing protein n=1 Tax=seawater metagenome TaxID=1561972 RepID=A0A5E8CJS9_9ZZZZ
MLRDLKRTDTDYLNLFNSKLSKEEFYIEFDKYNKNNNYYIKVYEEEGKIKAVGSFLLKSKFIRHLGYEGLIFDLNGKNEYTQVILDHFIKFSLEKGCYFLDIKKNNLDENIKQKFDIKETKLSSTIGEVLLDKMNTNNIRLLEVEDFNKGFLNVMAGMYIINKEIEYNEFNLFFKNYQEHENYFIIVKEMEDKEIIGTGSILIVDRLWKKEKVAIMDDIIVKKEFRNQNYSKEIVSFLNYLSYDNDCHHFMGKVRSDKLEFWKKLIPSTKVVGPHYFKVN